MWSRISITSGALIVGVCVCVALPRPTQSQPKTISPTPTPTKTPRPDQTAFVEGRVFDAKTKTPIVGARVSLEGNDDLFETTTDANGRYAFPHVKPGENYAWSATAGGYSGRSNYGTAGTPVAAKGWKFDIPLVPQAKIVGQVRDIAGRPVASADVRVYSQEVDGGDITKTDRNGRFVFGELDVSLAKASATYEVFVSNPRLSNTSKTVRARSFRTSGDESHISLTMPPRAVISGRMTFRGRPIRGAVVNVDQGGEDEPVGVTDKDGRYSFTVSAPAVCQARIFAEDFVSESVPVRVSPGRGSVLNRELKPFPYGSIRGRVVNLGGRPVEGASIELWNNDTSETEPVAVTGKDGRFYIPKVAPRDDYRVSVEMPRAEYRGGASTRGVHVRSYRTTFVEVRGDTIPPQLQLISPPRVLSGAVKLQYKASDNEGLYASHIEVDGGWVFGKKRIVGFEFEDKLPRETSGTWTLNSRQFSNGRHRLRVEINDRVGNQSVREWFVWIQNTGAPKPRPTSTPAPTRSGDGVGNAAVVSGSGY